MEASNKSSVLPKHQEIQQLQYETNNLVKKIEQAFVLLDQAASNYDNRYMSKVLRDLGQLRRLLKENGEALQIVVNKYYPDDEPTKAHLVEIVGHRDVKNIHSSENKDKSSQMDVDETGDTELLEQVLPEVNLYIHLLVQLKLLDHNEIEKLDKFNERVIEFMQMFNRRSLDFLQAKAWFYIFRAKELRNDFYSLRPALSTSLRTATLRHDSETAASVITLLLRLCLLSHDINQASNLVEKSEFPENAGNALFARYYYYLAKITAIQLDYSLAHEYVIAAIRKVPQTQFATGFIQTATKLSIVIELLMGEIPESKIFKNDASFEPYYMITNAVRVGDIKVFSETLKKYEPCFIKDNNLTLISRLRQNVIKTGIRVISLSYSRISLKDICIKLHLDSEELTEYIVAKAIRDGVIESSINHEKGYMQSKELLDVYSTKLPSGQFDQRTRFCLALHGDTLKSMRYPSDNKLDSNKGVTESKEDQMDLLRAIEEGDLDDFMD